VIGGLREAAAQRFDDFLLARGAKSVGKELSPRHQGGRIRTGDHLFHPASFLLVFVKYHMA